MPSHNKEQLLIHKKTLMVDLVKIGNDLSHTERNPKNPKYQIYYFPRTEKLLMDFVWLVKHHHNNYKEEQERSE